MTEELSQLARLARPCIVEGCARAVVARGFCHNHYVRWRRNGDPLVSGWAGRRWQQVDKSGPVFNDLGRCWIWTGTIDRHGYGRLKHRGRTTGVHRWTYQEVIGPIPEGFDLDHLCRNPPCVNPTHLEPVTHRENLLRGDTFTAREAAQTHCRHGHPFNEVNTRMRGGKRDCRTCQGWKASPYG